MKANMIIKKVSPHQSLHEFVIFAEHQVPNLIHNIKILREQVPFDLKNPVLSFLLNRCCNQVLEELVLRIHEGWEILNDELQKLKLPILPLDDDDYKDLDTLRNKLIAHRVRTGLYAKDNFTEWYSKKYGSHEKVFELISRITEKMTGKIFFLEEKELLDSSHASVRIDAKIKSDDIGKLLSALKEAKIY